MASYTLNALKKLTKEDMQSIIMNLQDSVQSGIAKISQDVIELKSEINQLTSKLQSSERENKDLNERLVNVEKKCFSVEQYSRRECLEVTGLSNTIPNTSLESTVLQIFEKIDVVIDPVNVEGCHKLYSRNNQNRIIIKLSRRKDVEKVFANKSKLKDIDLSDIGITDKPIYINGSFCAHYRQIWGKCKELWKKKRTE